MINLICDASTGNNNANWIVWVIFGVMIVGMVLLTVLPNRKRQKEYQQMQDNLRVGTKVMTIGRLIGVITKVYNDNTIELDVGTIGNPVIITMNREAIAVNLTAQAEKAAAAQAQAQAQAAPKAEAQEVKADVESAEENAEANAEETQVKKEDDAI